jgi:DNA repair photolyase
MAPSPPLVKGRGARSNATSRFIAAEREAFDDGWTLDDAEPAQLTTTVLPDMAKTIIARNSSPDIHFDRSINPYRGCEHGCIYCYARPFHEYLGYSAGLDFETKIVVKPKLPELLRAELTRKTWQPEGIALSGVTDCYQPVERRLQITRRCLEVLAEFRNPVGIVTKNALVARDVDVLAELARHNCAAVFISLTTLDPDLRSILEPRTSPPAARLAAIRKLRSAGIPVGVMIAPIIPALNDHEIPRLIAAAVDAGAQFAGRVVLRLPFAVAPLFEDWLGRHFPDRKEKVLNQVRDLREGRLNDPNFGARMTGTGPAAERIAQLMDVACRRAGIAGNWPQLTTGNFRRVEPGQLDLW